MKAVNQALDNAWATIAYKYVDDAKAAEARLKCKRCYRPTSTAAQAGFFA
jgi:hypothetical protein